MMYDGAVAATVAHAVQHIGVMHEVLDASAQPRHGEAAHPQAVASATPPAASEAAPSAVVQRDTGPHANAANAPQVVFIESNVANYQSLISQLSSKYQVVILDSSKDGLAQIAQWAQSHSGYGAIHIISHGQENDLQLGTTELTTANVASHQAELAAIGQALQPGGDILLYGCDVAAGTDGAALVNAIARESGRATAASTDATGAASLGGDWTLEYATGKLHVAALDLPGYHGLLTQPTSGTTSFDSLDGSTTVVPTGNATLTVSNYLGWNFTMNMNSNSDGQNEMIIVEKDGSSSTETVDALSNGVKQINYFSVKPNDGSLFTLNSITVVINGYDSTFNGGTMQLVGYLNGSAVAGATLSQSVSDIDNDGSPVTFSVSSNSNFVGIDSFRVIAANGHNVTGLVGIGAINATNFHFPGPTLTASGGSSAYSSGTGTAVTVDGSMSLSDTAASTQTSATVSITGNFHSAEDTLAFTNDGSTMGNISGSYNSGTGVLTLTSSGSTATNAQWQAALRAVTYQDTSLSPNTSTRTISFAITDASSNTSSTVTKTVSVAADSAPVISNLNGDSNTYYAGGSAASLDTGTAATVSDSDTTSFNGGNVTAHFSANGQSGEDVLGISTAGTVTLSSGTSVGSTVSVGGVAIGTIATNGDGVSGHDLIVTLNSNATASRVGTLVTALTYSDSAMGIPNTSTRTIQVTVNDGRGATSSASSVTMAVSAAPVLADGGGSAAFTAGDNATSTPVAVDSAITVTDNASSTLASGTVSITGNFHSSEDVLAFTNDGSTMGNISGSYNSGTGVLTLTSAGGTATLAQWQAALRSVTYTDSAVTPNTATRTVSFQVTDGSSNSSAVLTRTVTVAATDQTPLTTTSGGSAAFTAGDNATSTPVAVDSGLTVSDLDNATLSSATVSITGNFHSGEDVLAFTNSSAVTYGNITASYNSGTGVLTLTSSGSTATVAQWQAALRAVTYTDSAVTPNTATRTVSFAVSDGTKTSSAATRTVTVAATDQTPLTTTSGGSAAFTAGDNATSTPVAVDSGLTVSDLDNATLSSATVSITGNFHSGEDVLAFTNSSAVTYGNITASYNSGTGVLTLTSSGSTATVAQWQAALRAVTYTDSAVTPNTATRTVSFAASDGTKTSTAATRTVTVAATDQTPLTTTSGGSAAFTAGDNATSTPVAVDSGLTVSDLDNATLSSATVSITGNFHSGEDVLAFTNSSAVTYGNITASYNSGTGVLTLTSSGSTATVAQWQAALRAVTYTDSAVTPNTATRTVSFAVSDGTKTSSAATRTVTVAATDQTPLTTTSGGSAAFTAGDNATSTPVAVDSGLTVSDLDNATLSSATVSITGNFHSGEDVLAFTNSSAVTYGNITASYNSGTGVLTLTSSGSTATVAQWQAALRAVTYTDSAVTPNTATRTVSFAVSDGTKTSTAATRTVTVAATDQTPLTTTSGGSAAFTAGDNATSTPVAVDSGLTVSDLDNATLSSATVSITGNFHSGEDVLAFTNSSAVTYGNITASYNSGTGVLTLTSSGSTATVAQWQAALRAVTYTDSAVTPNTATRTVSFAVSDGTKTSTAATRTVTVAATDQTPLTTTSGGSAAFTAGDNATSTPVAVDSGLTVSDLDNATLSSATVSITGNFHSGEDVLAFTNSSAVTYGNITASYNSGTGVLTLTSSGSTATVAQWQAALRAVTYTDSAVTPNTATRTVSFAVSDGTKTSTAATRTVTVAATDQTPLTTTSGGSAAFTAGDNATSTPVAVDSGLTVSDLDNATLSSATVSITGNFHSGEDVLAFTNSSAVTYGNITASYNSGTGVLTLTSSGSTATVAQWQAALRAVTYTDSAVTPSTATRTVSFAVSDGTKTSSAATRTVTVAATDQTPLTTATSGNGTYTIGSTPTPVVVDSGLTVSDLDNATLSSATVSITGNFHSGEDVLAFTNSSAVTYGNIAASYNSGTGVLTLTSSGSTATVAQWQAALRAVTFNDTSGSPNTTTRVISFVVNDGVKNSSTVTRSIAMQLPTPTVTGLTAGTDTGSSSSDGITGNNTPTVTGTAVANSTVTIYVDSVSVGTTTANGSGAWSYNFTSSLSDGGHAITAMATSGSVNSSVSSAYNTTIDTAAPSTPVVSGLTAATDTGASSADGITSNNTPTLQGTAEANSTVTVYVDGTAVGTTTANGSGAWSYSLTSSLADGSHSIKATATDAAGNVSGQSTAYSTTIDTAAPSAPTVSGLTAATDTGASGTDGITSNNTPTLQGTAEANSTVTVYVDGSAVGTTTANGSGAWSYSLTSALADGSHSIKVTATDAAGNVSGQSTAYSTTIDTAAPSTPVVSGLTAATDTGGSSTDGITGNNRPTVQGTAEANGTVTVYVDGTAVGTTTANGSGAWSYSLTSSLVDGSHSIKATATDAAGNVSGQSTAYSVTVDTGSPNAPSGLALSAASDTGSSSTDGITGNNRPTVTGTAEAGSTVTVYVDGAAVGTATANGSGAWSYSLTSALADGSHSIKATATDEAGNVGSQSAAYNITVDTGSPAAPSGLALSAASDTGASSTDGITGNNRPTVTGTAEANSTVTVYVDGSVVGTTTANGSGAWSYSLTSSLADGSHSIKATATDAAGNVSGQSTAYSVTVDTGSPAAPSGLALSAASDTGSSSTDGITGNNRPTVTGTAEANSTVTVYVDGAAVGTATANGSGAWSYSLTSALADGSHSLKATATDAAGNVSGQSTVYSVTVDTGSPAAPSGLALSAASDTGASSTDGITGNNRPTVTGTAEANSTVTVYVDGSAVGTTTANGSGAWSYSLTSALADGSHSLKATATDAAGNVSGQSTAYSVTVDTGSPAAPSGLALSAASDTGASSTDGITGNNRPTVTGTAEANSTVTVYVDGSAVGTTTANGSGAWSYSLTSSLADGSHSLKATATDAAGNVSGQSTAYSVTVDTGSPAAPSGLALSAASDTGASSTDGITGNNRPTVTGTAEAGSTVTVYVDGSAVGTTTANGSGAWSYSLTSSLADGSHSIKATATDAAGNVGSQSTAYNITVDTSAPQVQSFTATSTLSTSSSTLSYQVVFTKPLASFTASDLSVLTSGSAHGTVASVTQVNATTYTIQLTGVGGDGALSVALKNGTIADTAGNTLSGTPTVPSYQVFTPVVTTSTVTPVTVTTTPIFTNTIQLPPITPNIVLAAVSGNPVVTTLSGNALTATTQTTVFTPTTGLGTGIGSGIATPTFGTSGNVNGSAPSFISNTSSNPTIALQVNPDLGVRPMVTGQSFSIALPPATIITRESSANLSINARQSNGQPLPSWLKFDPASGRFTGQAPAGWNKPISIDIQVQDKSGHQGSSHIQLNFGSRANTAPNGNIPSGSRAEARSTGKLALSQQLENHGHKDFLQKVQALLEGDVQV
nr:Ig-like domain-containing protein [Chromobacterium paludis]